MGCRECGRPCETVSFMCDACVREMWARNAPTEADLELVCKVLRESPELMARIKELEEDTTGQMSLWWTCPMHGRLVANGSRCPVCSGEVTG